MRVDIIFHKFIAFVFVRVRHGERDEDWEEFKHDTMCHGSEISK